MIYVIYFADEGTPKTDLFPTLDIFVKVSDGTSGGTPPVVSEISGGFYKFTYTPTEEMTIRVDSEDGTMEASDRYIPLVAGIHDDDLDVAISTRSSHSATDIYNISLPTSNYDNSIADILLDKLKPQTSRILGLNHENIFIDQPTYDDDDNLISGRLRIYDNSTAVGNDSSIIATYQITSTGSGRSKFVNWKMVKN